MYVIMTFFMLCRNILSAFQKVYFKLSLCILKEMSEKANYVTEKRL